MKRLLFFLSISFLSTSVFSEDKNILLDPILRDSLEYFNIRPLKAPPLNPNRAQVELGKKLFSDPLLSGNQRKSCRTCHDPEKGTCDSLPLSQSEDGKGILKRNSQQIFNLGLGNKPFMFWDGRVHYNFKDKVFTTPEVSLNGKNPKAQNITSVLTSALSAQALFPLVNPVEMQGKKGENEIADAKDNLEAWERITSRLKGNKTYKELFSKAYPETPLNKINIGHAAEAIGAFEREEFQSTGSPFNRYLKGDNDALTTPQKRGLMVFLQHGQCVRCHQGSELGNNTVFASISLPQWGEKPFSVDKGRGEVINDSKRNYFFRVPSLLNVGLTAPYMHNGAFQTLREVIEHYNFLGTSLRDFEISDERRKKIPVNVDVEKSPKMLDEIWLSSQVAQNPKIRNRLFLATSEKKYLEIFLREALTDPKFKKKN